MRVMPRAKTEASSRLAAPIAGVTVAAILTLNAAIFGMATRAAEDVASRESARIQIAFTQALSTAAEDLAAGRTDPDAIVINPSADKSLAAAARSAGSSMVWVAGRPTLVAAAPDAAGAPTLRLKAIGPEVLQRFAQQNGLADLRLTHSVHRDWLKTNAVHVGLGNSGPGAALEWRSSEFQAQLAPALPVSLSLTLVFILAGWSLYNRTERLAQSLVSSEAHAQHLALHDPMTGLANRALFGDRLELAIEQRRRGGVMVAVLAIDLDRFKQVNDTLGHQAGDELIREAGRRLAQVCRATDTVARLGGDEFAIVAPALPNMAAAEALIRRAQEAMAGMIDLPGGQAELMASIGVALIQDDQTDGDEAMRQADMALYKAKDEGRGRYSIYESEMDDTHRLRRATECDLRQALKNGEIHVHYQPQFAARTGRLDSVEALVRWTHDSRGSIDPSYFVPIAEETGLIHELGDHVMRQVFEDSRRWPQLRLAINVSPIQLRRPDFVDRCRRLLADTGAQADRIELEMPEGVLMANDEHTRSALQSLRALGFKLALDDFGTGYSSLSYLNIYPVDKIKIDQSFIRRLGVEEDADKVVLAIIRLGRALGLQVTAEGVETEAQRAELIAGGCSLLQGHLGGQPADASVIDTLVREEIAAAAHAA